MYLEEETHKIKTLVCFQSEEIPIVEETPLPKSMEIENPFVGNGVSEHLKVENPVVGIGESEKNPNCSEFIQFDETLIEPSSKIDEPKFSEPLVESTEVENQNIDETLDSPVKEEESTILGDVEIKKIVEDSMNEEEGEDEYDDLTKTLAELSPVAVEEDDSEIGKFDCTDILNDVKDHSNGEGEEELGLIPRLPWSEGRLRNYCNCSRCIDREEEEEWHLRNHGMGWLSSPRNHPRRLCRRRGNGFRREKEAELNGWNDRYSRDRFYNERFPPYLNMAAWYHEPEPCHVGAGLANLGNTCFMNAILQCFTHTVPLVQGFLSLKHEASSHGADEFCVLCAVRDQIECSIAYSGRVISPSNLVDNLNHISSYFRRYQQEDAHEFLQCLLDKLDINWAKYEAGANDSPSPTDTLVKQIFGGRLVSQVRCCSCGHHSDTYEHLIDLSLEIEDADSVEGALKSFTRVESIEVTENFACASCKEKVKVEKQLNLDKAPSVAALHLKRFKSDGFYVEKIDKKVEFPLELDMGSYSKGLDDGNEDLKYELFAVVVHVGLSSTSGHYFCYIRTSPEKWYRFDDSKVTLVDEESVLCQDAYILFYAKKETPWFDSLIENWKAECQEKILSTSPKSVLVDMDLPSTSLSANTGLGGDAIETRDSGLEVQNKPGVGIGLHGCEVAEVRDAIGVASIAPASELVQVEVKAEAAWDPAVGNQTANSSSSVPTSSTFKVEGDGFKENNATEEEKVCMETGKTEQISCGGTCYLSDVKDTFDDEPKIETDITPSTPPRALSPDIYSDEEPAEEAYSIPTNHLKIKDKSSSSAKKSANSLKQDIKRKEAAKYVRRAMPGGRAQLFMAAINGSKSDSSLLSKKRRKQATFLHTRQSPKKRVKVSPKRVLRPVTA